MNSIVAKKNQQTGPCGVFGCKGLGSTESRGFSGHLEIEKCPYAPQNLAKQVLLNDKVQFATDGNPDNGYTDEVPANRELSFIAMNRNYRFVFLEKFLISSGRNEETESELSRCTFD